MKNRMGSLVALCLGAMLGVLAVLGVERSQASPAPGPAPMGMDVCPGDSGYDGETTMEQHYRERFMDRFREMSETYAQGGMSAADFAFETEYAAEGWLDGVSD